MDAGSASENRPPARLPDSARHGAAQPDGRQPGETPAGLKAGRQGARQDYDVIVIGGGPQGTAIAYDLASRRPAGSPAASAVKTEGLKVLLLEKNDIGAGTSAYSSRLIHGGLRYLAQGAVRLVRESLREREHLLHNALHLVRPLALALPLYAHSKYNRLLMKLGMTAYDVLSYDKSMPAHRMLGRDALLRSLSTATPNGKAQAAIQEQELKGGAVYYDAQVSLPERLCLEYALAAQETGHTDIRTHTEVTGIEALAPSGTDAVADANRVSARVHGRDVLTGSPFTADARVVINAAGPWVDKVLQKIEPTQPVASTPSRKDGDVAISPRMDGDLVVSPRMDGDLVVSSRMGGDLVVSSRMGGTKGTHIIVRKPPGMPEQAFYSEAQKDGRPFFILPWRHDYYLIGTTDVRYRGDLDKIVASPEEIDYLLSEANHVLRLPGDHPLTRADVLYHYAGVRPLPKAPETEKEGNITREHHIEDHGRHQAKQDFIFLP